MHHCDLGLFNYQVNYTRSYIQRYCGQEGIDKFNNRLSSIPHFPELISFKHGLRNISAEYCSMMKQLVFVVDGLIITIHETEIG